ncbi:TetR/AcrR family transcriptional regulator [Cryptosporangium aurantiacum]|nr:TetR/AcrR family transcriptional regulator [Cryptosporangium aurantiacum]
MVTAPVGRPRSERARRAVLHAVDDLLVDVGYAAMTMKGIAERAGVGRQTVYRWWSTKAEILFEACAEDAVEELVTTGAEPYLESLNRFLVESPAGLAYRALVGEAQHDPAVRELLRATDPLAAPTATVLDGLRPSHPGMPEPVLAAAQLTGPVVAAVLTTAAPLTTAQVRTHVETLIAAWER